MKDNTILVVEDDENIRELYYDALTAAGLIALKAATGQEGVEIALSKHPKVILMDIMLPDISGHEAVKQIRHDTWGKNAHILFLTNKSDPEDVVQAVEQGSDDYIIKAHTEVKEVVNRVRIALSS